MPKQRAITSTKGRPKGSLNKCAIELKEAAQRYTPAALQVLQSIMCNPKNPAAARCMAASILLDRGHGKPHQSISADVQNENRFVVHMPSPMSHAEWAEYLKFKQRQIPIEQAKQQPKPVTIEAKPINGTKTPQIQ